MARLASTWALAILLSGCSMVLATPPTVTDRISSAYTPNRLVYCFGHGCAQQETIAIQPDDWQAVRALFANADADINQEHRNIRAAIGLLERYAGAQAGTSHDQGGTMEFGYDMGPPQLDCYDEAINASNFLGLLERDGLLRYHRVEAPVQRAFVNGDIIHATGVVRDVASGRRYAVDSSYFDNGEDASIAPLEDWLAGWAPPELTATVSN
jgi:hypothetical protein